LPDDNEDARRKGNGCRNPFQGITVLYRIYWFAWLAGTGLILLSWVDVVSPTIGWVGFGIACGAAFLSYIPRGRGQGKTENWVVLTKAMIDSKDRGYDVAMEQLRKGGMVYYDGIAFCVRPGNEIACAVVASWPVAELDEVGVLRDVERTKAWFEALSRLSPEIAAIALGKNLRVSLFSDYGPEAFEICQVGEGRIEWKAKI
jgi:hypothetical protein